MTLALTLKAKSPYTVSIIKELLINSITEGREDMMQDEIEKTIAKFKEDHSEIDEILKKFHISNEVYTKAMKSITVKIPAKPTYGVTVGGSYNVNASGSN